MINRNITLVIGLLLLLPFVLTAMVSSPHPTQASNVHISVVNTTKMVKPTEPTVPALPTPTGVVATITPSSIQVFYYSYYNPDLLAPSDILNGVCANMERGICHTMNCWEYDVMEGKCKSRMSSGLDWHGYVGKVVACGFEYPLGTVFQVLEPEKVAGAYACLDRCPACTGKNQLDFLSLNQILPWNQELLVQVALPSH